ncbi:MAG: response regulator transcription factor [Kiritimatiellae bacterium]|jgi:DNA-binding NarL/FixJ family response regulator|nr:response regulator transcription factor [Kiritimatiellia bacterium]
MNKNHKARIMLIEDHVGYREVITRALSNQPGIEIASQFGTAEIAIRSLQSVTSEMSPDLILLDLNLPGISGLEALPWLLSELPQAKVIILTQSDKKEDVLTAITHGAAGYLLKSSTVQQIRDGIKTVINGGASLDPTMAKYILDAMKTNTIPSAQKKVITEREHEVLILLGEGLVKKEIADRLNISVTTVVDHVRRIYEKLEVQNAPSAIHKAHNLGILPRKYSGFGVIHYSRRS